jgi:uncharacterized membrane protein YphA (DoxX/SURF4 family)
MAGAGLLLLRAAVGLITAWQGVTLIAAADRAWMASGAGLTVILIGASLILGLLTPCAAALAAVAAALAAFRAAGPIVGTYEGLAHGLVFIDALSVVLLGPGAFSVDARLFGRREIHIRDSYGAPPG